MASNHLLDKRVEAGLTQGQLAQKAGVSIDTILRAEKGERILPLNQAKIARALGLTRRDVFEDGQVSA